MTSETWKSEYLQLIEDCEARESRLSDWDRTFLDSIKNFLSRPGASLSKKQIEAYVRWADVETFLLSLRKDLCEIEVSLSLIQAIRATKQGPSSPPPSLKD